MLNVNESLNLRDVTQRRVPFVVVGARAATANVDGLCFVLHPTTLCYCYCYASVRLYSSLFL